MTHPILPTHHNFTNLTDQVFDRLTVVCYGGMAGKAHLWVCRCRCGNERRVRTFSLTGGRTRSCGCLRRDKMAVRQTRHGRTKTPEYEVWKAIRRRCNNPNHEKYIFYGGRGICICSGWDDFSKFFSDLGPRPSEGHQIDRKDSDGHYSCGDCPQCHERGWVHNCRWVTQKDNVNNRRSSRFLEYDGKRLTVSQWAEFLDVPSGMLFCRLRAGWPIELALALPRYTWPDGIPRTEEFRLQGKAHYAVRKAIRSGHLVRPATCQVEGCRSSKKLQAHHHKGYNEEVWLDVVWICPKHHNDKTFGRIV